MKSIETFDRDFQNFQLPKWMDGCPLAFDWCWYNGRVYFAALNYEESERIQKPVFDLAYCATKALNGIFLFRRTWDPKKFSRYLKNQKKWLKTQK